MNISYNWLKEYVDFDLTAQEVADALISYLDERSSDPSLDNETALFLSLQKKHPPRRHRFYQASFGFFSSFYKSHRLT